MVDVFSRRAEAKHPLTKVLISIGTLKDAKNFSKNSMTAESRQKLAASCVEIVNRFDFDGIDVDWEYPAQAIRRTDGSPADRKNFPLLIHEMRNRLGKTKLLTIATTAYRGHLKDLDVKELSKSVDWFGIMAYDFCMGASSRTCNHSLLVSADKNKSSGRSAIDWYVVNGASKNQIILGVPFYGYKWNVRSAANHGIDQEIIKSAKPNDYDGFIKYREIIRLKSKYQPFWDEDAKQPWLVDPSEKIAVGYEDEASLRIKARFVNEMDYGGIMIWELPYDSDDRTLLRVIGSSLKMESGH